MSDAIIRLRTNLDAPDLENILAAASTFLAVWQKGTFKFLPLLHESLERHSGRKLQFLEQLVKNAETVAVAIRSERLDRMLEELLAEDDPQEQAFYLEECLTSLKAILSKLDIQVSQLRTAASSIASLPVFDPSKNRASYLQEVDRLTSDKQRSDSTQSSKVNDLAALDEAIAVLEANGIERLFEGSLPTVEQVQALVSQGAAPGMAVAAVEQAIVQVNKLLGAALEGMRYAQLQDQRRALQAMISELLSESHDIGQRINLVQGYLSALEEYPALLDRRNEWLAGMNRKFVKLMGVANELRGFNLSDVPSLQAVVQLLNALMAYQQQIVTQYRNSL